MGINHWCHDDCEATSSGAVRSGLQHVSFWPMLLQLPAPVPPQLATHHGCMEDDEFCWRLVGAYGSAALVKLRYMCAKFDVGVESGGLQSAGQKRAKEAQAREAMALVGQWPEAWFFEKQTAKTGRLAGTRARLIAPPEGQKNVVIGGRRAGPMIERAARCNVEVSFRFYICIICCRALYAIHKHILLYDKASDVR